MAFGEPDPRPVPHSVYPYWPQQQQPGYPNFVSATSTNLPPNQFHCHNYCGGCGMVFEVEATTADVAEQTVRDWVAAHTKRCSD